MVSRQVSMHPTDVPMKITLQTSIHSYRCRLLSLLLLQTFTYCGTVKTVITEADGRGWGTVFTSICMFVCLNLHDISNTDEAKITKLDSAFLTPKVFWKFQRDHPQRGCQTGEDKLKSTTFEVSTNSDAVPPSWPFWPLKNWSFENPRWRWPPSWIIQKSPYLSHGSSDSYEIWPNDTLYVHYM